MESTPVMLHLDAKLCNYISSKDPLKKSCSNSLFMNKKSLSTFYGNMLSKANQQIKIHQKSKNLIDTDQNKLLTKEEHRIRQKIYSRTFYIKKDSLNRLRLDDKENTNMNLKPMICTQMLASRRFNEKDNQQQLKTPNKQSTPKDSDLKKQQLKKRKSRSYSCNFYRIRQKSRLSHKLKKSDTLQQISISSEQSINQKPVKSLDLNFLYQTLYEQQKLQKVQNTKIKQNPLCRLPRNKLTLNGRYQQAQKIINK